MTQSRESSRTPPSSPPPGRDDRAVRATFATSLGAVLTMIGVAIGLGNFWRFPYLVGRFGGAAFVAFYLLVIVAIGVPALSAEWALGRHTRRGAVGAYERAGVPFGRAIGWLLFILVIASLSYYAAAVGWVLCFAVGQLLQVGGIAFEPAWILPPERGFDGRAFALQLTFTGIVALGAALILTRGLRRGVEAVSRVLVPGLFVVLVVLIVRSLTLPGAGAGLSWYLLKFRMEDLTAAVMVAALGQAMFSLALGGTFMVVYGSYLDDGENLRRNAIVTASADTLVGLLAGIAIFPAVFALGLEPGSGPVLLFDTLPRVFGAIPGGRAFAFLFFTGLGCVALLSAVAALEVVVAGLTDNTRLDRATSAWLVAAVILALSTIPTLNLEVFVPWDLTFGSGVQTLGALLAVLTVGWALDRATALRALSQGSPTPFPTWLYWWLKFVVPGLILMVGCYWFLSEVLGLLGRV
jgi:NSS family neurotransmitter:Na+ symporter